MKKFFMLLAVATMLATTSGVTLAATGPAPLKTTVKKYPLEGYDYGYAAAGRYLKNNPSEQQLKTAWHDALCNAASNAGTDQGRADYYQGYADGLHYADNEDIPCR